MAYHIQPLRELATMACQETRSLHPGRHGLREDQCNPLLHYSPHPLPCLPPAEFFVRVRDSLTKKPHILDQAKR